MRPIVTQDFERGVLHLWVDSLSGLSRGHNSWVYVPLWQARRIRAVSEDELRELLGSTNQALVELLPQGNGKTCEICEFLPPEPDGTPLREARLRINAVLNDFSVCGEHASLALGLLRPAGFESP